MHTALLYYVVENNHLRYLWCSQSEIRLQRTYEYWLWRILLGEVMNFLFYWLCLFPLQQLLQWIFTSSMLLYLVASSKSCSSSSFSLFMWSTSQTPLFLEDPDLSLPHRWSHSLVLQPQANIISPGFLHLWLPNALFRCADFDFQSVLQFFHISTCTLCKAEAQQRG